MKVKKYLLTFHLNVIKARKIKGIRLNMIFDEYTKLKSYFRIHWTLSKTIKRK